MDYLCIFLSPKRLWVFDEIGLMCNIMWLPASMTVQDCAFCAVNHGMLTFSMTGSKWKAVIEINEKFAAFW